ncbi:MAG: PA2169 family four-helix-bundle protein [Pseudomonadota bacterium]|nr:PA2169 family four-helix-bundle protein [Pseudomonadota bacterium]
MTETDRTLKHIIGVLQDGLAFYREAATVTGDVAHRQLFERMAEEREIGIRQLLPYVSEDIEAPFEDESLGGAMRRFYAEALSLVRDPDAVYVDQLEDNEDQLLRTIDEALQNLPNGPARDAVALIRENFVKTHATMVSLKRAL